MSSKIVSKKAHQVTAHVWIVHPNEDNQSSSNIKISVVFCLSFKLLQVNSFLTYLINFLHKRGPDFSISHFSNLTDPLIFNMCWLEFIPFWVELICLPYDKCQKNTNRINVSQQRFFSAVHPLLVALDTQMWLDYFICFSFWEANILSTKLKGGT